MQRWQRRAHLWLWLGIAVVVGATLIALVEDQPRLSASFDSAPPE
jgi:hypothetical protein